MRALKVIIHIGTEKTGSTAIQKCIQMNLEKLREQGVYVAKALGTHQTKLIAYCLEDHKTHRWFQQNSQWQPASKRAEVRRTIERALVEELNGKASDIGTLLISHEHFHSRVTKKAEIERLKYFIEHICESLDYDPDVSIVLYVRDQADMLESLYFTYLIYGGTQGFRDFAKQCHPDNYYYNHAAIYRNWTSVFGKERVILGRYDRQTLLGGDIRRDFFQRLGLNSEGLFFESKAQNQSVSRFGLWVLRLVNSLFGPKVRPDGRIDIQLERLQNLILKYVSKGRSELLKKEQRREIEDAFREANAKLVGHFSGNASQIQE